MKRLGSFLGRRGIFGLKILLKRMLRHFVPLALLTKSEKEINLENENEFLEGISADSKGSCIRKNHICSEPEYDLQIVIPAFNAEKTIKRCINSILEQASVFKVLMVVINDGSTDLTGEILKDYSHSEKIKVISQENRGFSGARNRGLENINARYVMFVDSDDFLMPNAVQSLMQGTENGKFDIIQGDYSVSEVNSVKTIHCESLYGFPWGKVYKSVLFEKLIFPEGYWFEDTVGILVLFSMAKNFKTVRNTVYSYTLNPLGITKTSKGKPKIIDSFYVTRALLEDRRVLGLSFDMEFCKAFLYQVVANFRRIKTLRNECVNKSVFCLSCELLEKYFPGSRFSFENIQTMNFFTAR